MRTVEFVPNVQTSLIADLSAELFQRSILLSQRGMNSFMPYLDFVRRICGTPENLKQFEELYINSARFHMDRVARDNSSLKAAKQLAAERAKQSGHVWDHEVTPFDREISKMRSLDPSAAQAHDLEVEELRLVRWKDEVNRFVGKQTWGSLGSSKASLESRGEKLNYVAGRVAQFGFQSRERGSFVFSKPIGKDHELCFAFELQERSEFTQPNRVVTRFSNGFAYERLSNSNGSKMNVSLIFKTADDKHAAETLSYIEFNYLFPIFHNYRFFYDGGEFITLVSIYLLMYEVIGASLEHACVRATEYL